MYRQPWAKTLSAALCLSFLVTLPGWTQSTKKDADKKELPLSEQIKLKYPLSTTPKTEPNQNASTHMQEGIRLYQKTRKMFEAANDIKSSFRESDHILEVEQKGIIQTRLSPEDILKYGPEHAHIGLRIRALQNAEKVIAQAIGQFAQARQMAPTLAVIPRWQRIADDTRKAIRFHIAYYHQAFKGLERGVTELELEMMAAVWALPKQGDNDTLTLKIYTVPFEITRGDFKKTDEEKKEKVDIEGPAKKLPDMDFSSDKK